MENSDSEDEENGSSAHLPNQKERLAREAAFFRFVNNMSKDEYRLVRENNLLGTPCESTEELVDRLRGIKGELPPHNADEEDSSDEEYNSASHTGLLNTFGQTENMTSTARRGNRFWTTMSQCNPNHGDLRFRLQENFNQNQNPNPESVYAPSATYSRGQMTQSSSPFQVENPLSESKPWITRADLSAWLTGEVHETRGQKRPRSRSPEYRRTVARLGSWSPVNSMNHGSQSPHHMAPSQIFEHPLAHEMGTCPCTHYLQVFREQIAETELQNRGLLTTSETIDQSHEENSPDTNNSEISWQPEQGNPSILLDLEVRRADYGELLRRDNIASGHLLTPQSQSDSVPYEGEQGLRHMLSQSEQPGIRMNISTTRIPIQSSTKIALSETTPAANQSTLRQVPMGLEEPNCFMSNDSSDFEPGDSPQSQNLEHAESESGGCHDINHFGSHPNSDIDYNNDSSISSLLTLNSTSSSPMSSSSSSSDISEISSVLFEDSNEGTTSSSASWDERQVGQGGAQLITESSDTWPFLNLAQLFHLNQENQQPQHRGLTKEQMDNFKIRISDHSDTVKSCSVCITEYTEGNKICILPCSHEYHAYCIDRWLTENPTCPICRRNVIDSDDTESI